MTGTTLDPHVPGSHGGELCGGGGGGDGDAEGLAVPADHVLEDRLEVLGVPVELVDASLLPLLLLNMLCNL